MTKATLIKAEFIWVSNRFRGSIQYHHCKRHASIQADMMLEKKLRVLHLVRKLSRRLSPRQLGGCSLWRAAITFTILRWRWLRSALCHLNKEQAICACAKSKNPPKVTSPFPGHRSIPQGTSPTPGVFSLSLGCMRIVGVATSPSLDTSPKSI